VLLAAWLAASSVTAQEKPELRPAVAMPHPIATDVRVAGDEKRTRFILELDRKIDMRAFALANPNRIVVDTPQLTFGLPAGVGDASRGLVKAFRYGLVMPGGSRIVMDLKRPAKIDKA
jgi:N-acetylmuramoyl-L-alanine amidase